MQSETLAQEFVRLVKEYHEADDHTKPEAWNLLADYAVENASAISAALSDQERAVEVKNSEWHRSDRPGGGSVMLYTLREEGRRRGEPVMTNDVMINIDRGTGSSTDIEPIVQRIRSALVDVPVEPVNRKFKLRDRVSKTKGSSWNGHVVGFYSTELTPVGYAVESSRERGSVQNYPEAALKLIGPASPPHREGEDSAEVIELGGKLLAAWLKHSWDGLAERDISDTYPDFSKIPHFHGGKPALRKVAAAILALAATRSGSASTTSGCVE